MQNKYATKTLYIISILFLFLHLNNQCFAVQKLDGNFIGIYQGDKKGWSASRWGQELGAMRNIGMNTVIVSCAVYNTTAFYTGCSLTGSTTLDDTLPKIFDVADTTGMTIIIGLYMESSSWSTYGKTSSYLTGLCTQSKKVCDDLWSKYSTRPSFKGWYIPQEIENLSWTAESNRQNLVKYFLRPLSDHCRAKKPSMLVCEANYFNDTLQSATAYGAWWKTTLGECTSLNLLIPQDGIGAAHADYTTVRDYLSALQSACTSQGRTMWCDLEVYNTLADQGPATLSRITAQLAVEAPYVTGFVCWEYYSCFSPLNYSRSSGLYTDYLENVYYENLAWGKSYTVSPTPHATYLNDGIKLTDSLRPYSWASQVGWQRPASNPIVTVDLSSTVNHLFSIKGYCMRSDGSAVYAPQYLSVAGSLNGVDYTTYGNASCSSTVNNAINTYTLSGTNFSARYLKITLQPDVNNQFSMINEVIVHAANTLVPVELNEFYTD